MASSDHNSKLDLWCSKDQFLSIAIEYPFEFAIFRLSSQGMAIMQNPKIQVFADAIKFMGRYEADV